MTSIQLNSAEKELILNEKKNEEVSKEKKSKEIYFIIRYERKEMEKPNDFFFTKIYYKIDNIYIEVKQEKDLYIYKKVFKVFMKEDNSKEDYKLNLSFKIGGYTHTISFNVDDKSFYYDIEHIKVNKLLSILPEHKQNFLNYYQKLELFIAALKQNKEEGKIDNLYEETIKLYSKMNEFYLLLLLFVKIYEKQNLCPKLIEEFNKMNKDNKNEIKEDGKSELNAFVSSFSKISSEADNIIKTKGYNPIHFYGIILCYLNHYDYENFKKYLKKLYEEKCGVLYEILIIYNTNFLKPIIQDLLFFENFIKYVIKNKGFDIFENSLYYILDVEIFINVIDKEKENIIERYRNSGFKTIKIKPNLKIKKKEKGKEIENIISAIKSIIDFSRKNNKLLIYFNSNFWINILKHYKKPEDLNIYICYKLRELLKEYYNLIEELFKNTKKDDEKKIKNDIKQYLERDEIAFVLDKNMKLYFKNNKEITNEEIIGFIKEYNPYYKEDKYIKDKKRDSDIFDFINFNQIDRQFIEIFKKFEFEEIFKEKITNFTNKMISKIQNIYIFSIIIELIDINKISQDKSFLPKLKLKYEKFVKKINSLTGEKLNEIIKVIAKFVDYLYIQENNLDFLEQKIDKLNKNIKPLIYNELMIRCQDEKYNTMKEYIFKKYLSNIDNINNIIILIDNLSKNNKIKFLDELMKRCLFTREEFYSNYQSPKILLLCKLYEKRKLEILNEDNYYGNLENLLINLKNEIEGDIEKKTLEEFLMNGKDVVVKRLGLIKIIFREYNPEKVYLEKKAEINRINEDIKELTFIKNFLSIFHR